MLHNATYKISIIYIINYIYTYYLSGQVHKTQEKGWLYLYNCNFQILQIFQDICQSIERIEFVPSLFWGATVSTLYNNVFLRSIHHHCASRVSRSVCSILITSKSLRTPFTILQKSWTSSEGIVPLTGWCAMRPFLAGEKETMLRKTASPTPWCDLYRFGM